MRKINFIFVGIAILLFQNALNAQLYWSESFGNYSDGQIISGTNRWDMQNATAGYAPASTSPLTYGSLQSNAEYFKGGGGWTGAGVVVPMTYPSQYFDDFNGDGQWLTCGYKTGGSNELWFSMLVRPDVNGDFQIWLNSSHIAWETKSGNLNIIRSAGKWGLGINGTNTLSSIDATVGSTYLIAAKVNFASSNTTITLYVNPTLGVTPATAAATASSTSPLLFYSIGMYLNSNANSVSIDEMRIGKTFADVTPLVADVTSPSTPNGLSSSSITSTSYTLSWNASTDNVGVTAYDVYKDGVKVGTTASTSMNITGLSPSTTYAMTVIAKDAAGNASSASTALNVSTNAAISDVSPPSTPSNLSSSSISITGFTLSWNASTDNVGVIAYDVYKDGTKIGSTASTSLNITGLSGSTTYAMTVVARDAADNASSASTALNVTTLDAPLITDGGFEALVVNGTQQIPQGSAWSFVGRWNNCGITSEAGHYAPIIYDGNQTAFFMDDDTHSSSISQTVTLKKGTYAFSIWASLPSWQSGAQPLKLSVGNVTYDIPMQNAHPGQWEKIMTNFDISSQGSYVLKIWANLASGNQIYINFDDASLQDITPAASPITVNSNTNISSLSTNSDIDVTVSAGELTIDVDATVKSMTLIPGAKLTLASGKTICVVGAFVLLGDATGTATLVNNGGTITTGSTSVQQYLTSGRNWYVSSPVSGSKSAVFSATSDKPLYCYDEVHGTSAPWTSITNSTTDLSLMKGYVVNPASTGIVTFNGTLNTTGSVTLSRTAGQVKEGFNLVGNPYTAHTTITKSITDAANALNTIWYRTATWDGTKYVYTFQTCLLNSNGSYLGTPELTSPTIAPMQAFWVRANANGTTLDFSTAVQSHQSANPLKAPALKSISQEMLRLQVTNSDAIADETVLYFNQDASNSFDSYDAQKMFNNSASVAEIYTVAGNENLAINGLNTISYDTEMPLGFNTVTAGTFSIKASQIANFAQGTQVILKDYADVNNPVTTDLSDGSSYSFTSTATSNNTSRFTLIFRAPSVTTGINPENNNIWISSLNGQLVVNGITNNNTMLEVFNAVGQKIISRNLTGSTIDLNTGLVSGAYLARVTFEGKSITRKIIID
jgi:chitodextrinase